MERQERLIQIRDMLISGASKSEIVKHFDGEVHNTTIYNDIRFIRQGGLEDLTIDNITAKYWELFNINVKGKPSQAIAAKALDAIVELNKINQLSQEMASSVSVAPYVLKYASFLDPQLTFDLQRNFVYSTKHTIAVKGSPKCGKTHGAMEWLWDNFKRVMNIDAIIDETEDRTNPEYGVKKLWWISLTYELCGDVFDRYKSFLREHEIIDQFKVVESKPYSIEHIESKTRIEFKTSQDPNKLWGRHVYAMVFDESDKAKPQSVKEAMTTLTMTRGPVLMLGNNNIGFTPLDEMIEKILGGEVDGYTCNISVDDALQAGIIDMAAIDEQKQRYSQWEYEMIFELKDVSEHVSYFQRDFQWIKRDYESEVMFRVRAWDMAYTQESPDNPDPDYTVGALLAMLRDGTIIIEDIQRFRRSYDKVKETIIATIRADGTRVQSIIEEPATGESDINDIRDELPEYIIDTYKPINVKNAKAKRASGIAQMHNTGNVYLVEAEWNTALINECKSFTGDTNNKRHDDQVDAIAIACNHMYNSSNTQTSLIDLYRRT